MRLLPRKWRMGDGHDKRGVHRKFKNEAARRVMDRGVAVDQAARDLDVAESVLRRWTRELAEITAQNREVIQPRAERDIPIKATFFRAIGDMKCVFIEKNRHFRPII
jgi:transposase